MEKKKNFWKNTLVGITVKNIFLSAVILAGLVWGALILIDIYTNHGNTEKVPSLKGLSVADAKKLLDNHDLKLEIIDSVYIKESKLGVVIEQNPFPNSTVKPGRTVYLVVNSQSVRQVAVPEVIDISLRQAEAMLISSGLALESVMYAPSDYRDLVIDIKYLNQSVAPGSKLPEGTSVALVVGNGQGANLSVVPSLQGLNIATATGLITSSAYTLGGVIYDVEPEDGRTDGYFVYKQKPMAGDSLSIGNSIDVWVTKDLKSKQQEIMQQQQKKAEIKKQKEEEKNAKDIEDFF